VDRDPISGALYSGALTLDPLWNTSERCAGGDLGITARLLFTVPVQAACVFSIGAMADAWLGYPVIG
jgi:hypothetical protein